MNNEQKTTNKFGLSRKTNIAIAAIGGISVVKDVWFAIVAVTVIALVSVSLQFAIDYKKGKNTII